MAGESGKEDRTRDLPDLIVSLQRNARAEGAPDTGSNQFVASADRLRLWDGLMMLGILFQSFMYKTGTSPAQIVFGELGVQHEALQLVEAPSSSTHTTETWQWQNDAESVGDAVWSFSTWAPG